MIVLLVKLIRPLSKGGEISVDDETAGIINYAATVWHESNGLFDVTSGVLRNVWDFKSCCLPSQKSIDDILPLVGWGKLSWNNGLLAFSLAGSHPDGSPWMVGIRNPRTPEQAIAMVPLHKEGLPVAVIMSVI
jgi:thiamine biosynthesis lipoprotein ApbE